MQFHKILNLIFKFKVVIITNITILLNRKYKKYTDYDLIISLTSYRSRLNTIKYTLYTLLNQNTTIRYRIYLTVSHDDYDIFKSELTYFIKNNIKILRSDDLKSYKKYYPMVFLDWGGFSVTADDDLLYNKFWLNNLLNSASIKTNKNSKYIYASRIHKIIEIDGLISSYSLWEYDSNDLDCDSKYIFGTTGAGMLFPPNFFKGLSSKIYAAYEIAPTTDDVWVYYLIKSKKYRIIRVNKKFNLISIKTSSNLFQDNINLKLNDKAFKDLSYLNYDI